jgi:hypothetical protein
MEADVTDGSKVIPSFISAHRQAVFAVCLPVLPDNILTDSPKSQM